jgi:hypothetical protein
VKEGEKALREVFVWFFDGRVSLFEGSFVF